MARSDSIRSVDDKRSHRRKNKLVYQDGAYRNAIRNAPKWNRKISFGVLGSVIVLIVLFVIGFFYFNQETVKELISISSSKPLLCGNAYESKEYSFFYEDSLTSPEYKYYFFESRLSFAQAQQACKKLPQGGGDLVTIQSTQQEKAFDRRVREQFGKIFVNESRVVPGLRKQLWTGGYIDLERDGLYRIRWLDETFLHGWNQFFCDRSQALQTLNSSLAAFKKNKNSPLIYIVKDYRESLTGQRKLTGEFGCWQLYSSGLYEMEHLTFNFACQISTMRLPFQFKRKFLGKFRPNTNNQMEANEYAVFAGRGPYTTARETCQRFVRGSHLLETKTLARDYEVNKRVERHSIEIFGEDNGDPKRRTLIWTGGYFNLSSANPTKVRWISDPNANLDVEEPPRRKYFGSSNEKPMEYENFCGTLEYYNGLIIDALSEERDTSMTDCIKERLFMIVKDYREGQSVQGCWHVYDYDYLRQYDYHLYLICQLPNPIRVSEDILKQSKEIFSYIAGEP